MSLVKIGMIGTFASRNASNNVTVTVSGLTITGSQGKRLRSFPTNGKCENHYPTVNHQGGREHKDLRFDGERQYDADGVWPGCGRLGDGIGGSV